IDSHGVTGGYVDPIADPLGALGKPSTPLYNEITFVDAAIGKLVSELKLKGLFNSTTIIISAKHGQSPIRATDTREAEVTGGPTPRRPALPAPVLRHVVYSATNNYVRCSALRPRTPALLTLEGTSCHQAMRHSARVAGVSSRPKSGLI